MSHTLPALTTRHDGWTPARQAIFLTALADIGSVSQAAAVAGMSRAAAYALRRHPDAGDFRAAWDLALADAMRQIEELLIERVIGGETITVTSADGSTHTRHQPCNEKLAVLKLARLDAMRSRQQNLPETSRNTPQTAPAAPLAIPCTPPNETPAHHAFHNLARTLPDREGWLAPAPRDASSTAALPPPVTLPRTLAPGSSRIPSKSSRPGIRPPRDPATSDPAAKRPKKPRSVSTSYGSMAMAELHEIEDMIARHAGIPPFSGR
ncbi:hypothetical protein GCM10007973_14810 [Polymorphobacter multimanifer]|uniref:hypothetical protein n=1 Tax=Polymorphobacter multimanifer TaxID=1070431 RepID=UPI001668CAC1|nr:hypothetical protein [Polymorphobacter multimanifer]GGI79225.1 hypothetical protein GCM10007973_14810 [Polymorphobacter multimanifer]